MATANGDSGPLAATARPLPAEPGSMEFWDEIFTPAMETLKAKTPSEPKGRFESGYGVRGLESWGEVFNALQMARVGFDNPQEVMGGLKKGFRKVVDHSQPLRGALKLVPDIDCITPVTGTLAVILDVGTISSIRLARAGTDSGKGSEEDYSMARHLKWPRRSESESGEHRGVRDHVCE